LKQGASQLPAIDKGRSTNFGAQCYLRYVLRVFAKSGAKAAANIFFPLNTAVSPHEFDQPSNNLPPQTKVRRHLQSVRDSSKAAIKKQKIDTDEQAIALVASK
jgi:hypothetical protein